MTTTPGAPPTPSPLRSLRRSTTDTKIAGVCGGLAQALRVDPLVLRIAVVVLAVFGGSGVLIYALAWLLVPEEGQQESAAQRLVRGRGDISVLAPIAGLVLGLVLINTIFGDGPSGFVVVAVLAGVGIVVALRGERDPLTNPPPRQADSYGRTAGTAYATPPMAPYPVTAYPPGVGAPPPPVSGWLPPGPVPPPRAGKPPKPPRPPAGPLAALTLSGAVLLTGAAWVVAELAGSDVGPLFALGLATAAVGVGIAAASVWGRAGALPVLGATLVVALVLTGAIRDEVPGRGWGDATYRPTSVTAAERRIDRAAGDVTVDLRSVPLDGRRVSVRARLAAGDLLVIVPAGVALEVSADIRRAGEIVLPDTGPAQADEVHFSPSATYRSSSGAEKGTVVLDLDMSFGRLEVQQ